jgi:hypothetical protein
MEKNVGYFFIERCLHYQYYEEFVKRKVDSMERDESTIKSAYIAGLDHENTEIAAENTDTDQLANQTKASLSDRMYYAARLLSKEGQMP